MKKRKPRIKKATTVRIPAHVTLLPECSEALESLHVLSKEGTLQSFLRSMEEIELFFDVDPKTGDWCINKIEGIVAVVWNEGVPSCIVGGAVLGAEGT